MALSRCREAPGGVGVEWITGHKGNGLIARSRCHKEIEIMLCDGIQDHEIVTVNRHLTQKFMKKGAFAVAR
jgi:hypothetical protein